MTRLLQLSSLFLALKASFVTPFSVPCRAFPRHSVATGSLDSLPSRRETSSAVRQSRRDQFEDDESTISTPFIGVPAVDRQRRRRDDTTLASTRISSFLTGDSNQASALLDQNEPSVFADRFLGWAGSIQRSLDDLTDGWALSYADLSPDTPTTVPGATFLATNAAYLLVGFWVLASGDVWFAFWTEACAIASFNYHYNQLMSAGTTNADAVRLALFLDYIAAAFSMTTASIYIFSCSTLPVTAVAVSALGLVFLGMSWVYEYGRPYMIWHSLWHLSSAYSGFLIGSAHSVAVAAAAITTIAGNVP